MSIYKLCICSLYGNKYKALIMKDGGTLQWLVTNSRDVDDVHLGRCVACKWAIPAKPRAGPQPRRPSARRPCRGAARARCGRRAWRGARTAACRRRGAAARPAAPRMHSRGLRSSVRSGPPWSLVLSLPVSLERHFLIELKKKRLNVYIQNIVQEFMAWKEP